MKKDNIKKQILTLIIGMLIGSIITTGVFLIIKNNEGVITNISSSASNGKFTVTIEFGNDSNVLIGMSSEVTI